MNAVESPWLLLIFAVGLAVGVGLGLVAGSLHRRSSESGLRDSFAALAGDAVRQQQQDLTQRSRETLEQVVQPLRLTLSALDTQVRGLEVDRQGDHKSLRRELGLLRDAQRTLHQTTRDLRHALTSSGPRGRWGEIQLRRLVEMSGLGEHVDFSEQPTVSGQRPDMVVHLPGDAHLPIDAKAPMAAYLAASEEDDPARRRGLLDDHLRALKRRTQELGSREYWRTLDGSPDFVVMFLPHEGCLSAAFDREPELLEYCIERKVLPATPVTLLALLRTIAWGWQQHKVTDGAVRIADAGRQVHQRLGTLLDHLARLGQGLGGAVDAYNATVGSLERRLMPAVRRLEDAGGLEASTTPPPVVVAPRAPSSGGDSSD